MRGFHRSGYPAGLLIWLLLGAAQAAGLPEQAVPGTGGQVIIRRTSEGNQALLVVRAGRRRAILNDQSLVSVPMAPIGGRPAVLVRGWSGGAYCCFDLHILTRGQAGWHFAGSVDVGKGEGVRPWREGALLWLPDAAATEFWDTAVSLGNSLRTPLPYRLRGGRLVIDVAAMRRPVAEALGVACLRRGGIGPRWAPPSFRSLEELAAYFEDGDWGQEARMDWRARPEAEFARRALCLLYAGHGREALRLIDLWPAGRPDQHATIRQIRARLVCSGPLRVLRALNGADHPWLTGACDQAMNADRTLLSDLTFWRDPVLRDSGRYQRPDLPDQEVILPPPASSAD